MKNALKNRKQFMGAAALLCLTLTAVAWQTDNRDKKDTSADSTFYGRDTTEPQQHHPGETEPGVSDFGEAMKALDRQMQQLDVQMKDMSKQLQLQLSQINVENISNQVTAAIGKIDFDQIKATVDKSIAQAQEQVKNINLDKLKTEMEDAQRQLSGRDFQKEIDSAMHKAMKGLEQAKKELQDMKDFTDGLEKDGLIDKKKGYSIEWKNGGELYINGKKQPDAVSEKYRKYYKKDGWRIEMNGADGKGGQFL